MNLKNQNGLTLIELLIVIVILSTLLMYAIPTYNEYVLRSKRTEAHNALLQLVGIQERHYANKNRYGSAAEINLTRLYPAPTTANKLNYTITMANTNTTYTIKATAYGSQTEDTSCLVFTIDNLGQKLPAQNCW